MINLEQLAERHKARSVVTVGRTSKLHQIIAQSVSNFIYNLERHDLPVVKNFHHIGSSTRIASLAAAFNNYANNTNLTRRESSANHNVANQLSKFDQEMRNMIGEEDFYYLEAGATRIVNPSERRTYAKELPKSGEIGTLLRELRLVFDMSEAEVEQKTGITLASLGKIEFGKRMPRLSTIAKFLIKGLELHPLSDEVIAIGVKCIAANQEVSEIQSIPDIQTIADELTRIKTNYPFIQRFVSYYKHVRKNRGINVKQLAYLMNIDIRTFNQYERDKNGNTLTGLEHYLHWTKCLGLKPNSTEAIIGWVMEMEYWSKQTEII